MLQHKHILIRAEVNVPPRDPEWLEQWMRDLIEKIGMKVLHGPTAKYVEVPGNRGATCVAIIETSHIAIHVWDETDPALVQLDVYTCGELDPEVVFKHLEIFGVKKLDYKYLDREHGFTEVEIKNAT